MSDTSRTLSLSDISPVCLLRMIGRHLWMVAASALIFAMGAFLYRQWLCPPVYRATMTYAVTSRKTGYTSQANLTAAREVAAVLSELLETDVVTDSLKASSEKLRHFDGTIRAQQVTESNFLVVSAESERPEEAFWALNQLIEVFPSFSQYISDSSVVAVLRNPAVSPTPINTVNTKRLYLLAGAAGAALMLLLLVWLNLRRETVQTRTGARHLLDAPVLVSIGHERRDRTLRALFERKKNGHARSLSVLSPTASFAYTEQIHTLCTRVEQEMAEKGRRVFLVAGVGENEGKSTVAANLAAALASQGRRTVLVDADLRNPTMRLFFEDKRRTAMPLNALLALPFSEEALSHCIQKHRSLELYFLFSNEPDRRSTELLTGLSMDGLLDYLRSAFDCVIIDSPPMAFFPDAEALAEKADASLLVVRQDATPACDINDAADSLRHARAAFLGCVLNDMRTLPSGLHRYGKSGYGYGYGYGYDYSRSNRTGSHHR